MHFEIYKMGLSYFIYIYIYIYEVRLDELVLFLVFLKVENTCHQSKWKLHLFWNNLYVQEMLKSSWSKWEGNYEDLWNMHFHLFILQLNFF